MSYVKTKTTTNKFRANLLRIKDKKSLSQIISLVNSKKPDYLILEKPNLHQMTAALLLRLAGKKFIWIQEFANPPKLNFLNGLLISQADRIITSSKKDIVRLKNFGIAKTKIRYQR